MKIALVRLRESGQLMTYKVVEEVSVHDYVIVEADRGLDYGEIIELSEMEGVVSDTQEKTSAFKNIIRKSNQEDIRVIRANKKEAKDAMRICARKIREYKLDMKLIDVEYSYDKKKIVFYFTAQGRVDFRELVKELAKVYKIRIEMRQIGVRDEARMFSGVGPCGQTLCCVRFLKRFEPVNMRMAKVQKLPLSSGKISGICGRLMCCLFYEYKTYKELSKGLPKEGQTITVGEIKGKVVAVSILKQTVDLELEDGRIERISFSPPCSGPKNCQNSCNETEKDE